MKTTKALTYLFLSLLVVSSCKCKKEDEKTVFGKIHTEVSQHTTAYNDLEKVTDDITKETGKGHRLTGTKNGELAEQMAFDLFKKYGYNPEFFEFEAKCWQRNTVEAHFFEDANEIPIDAVSLAMTPVDADVTSEVIDCGNGLQEDFDRVGDNVKGKICLLNIGLHPEDSTKVNLHRSEKTALALKYGAVGCIFMNKVQGRVLLTGTASVTDDLVTIPAVCVSFEDGMMMRERMGDSTQNHKYTAHLKMTNSFNTVKSRDIIVTLEGSDKKDEIVGIGGHLDCWDLAQGAIDNGVGSFSVIDIARTFKVLDLKPRRTIKFVLWMGEEEGLLGSKALLKKWREDGTLAKLKTYINLDMSGNPQGFNDYGRSEWATLFNETGTIMHAVDTTYKNKNTSEASLHSDHQEFMLEGIPVIEQNSKLDESVVDFYHSNGDELSLVNKKHLETSVEFTAMLLYAIANVDEIPAKPLNSDQTRDYLIQQKLKEPLTLEKEWKWGQ